jgi:TonB family protein
MKAEVGDMLGSEGERDFIRIPDRNSFTRENAIFYSSDGMFSFNTKKFAPFKYFKEMKDRIAGNWYPPLLANAIIYGYDPMSGSYTPGRLRIMAIPDQMVKLYFTMNRRGDVLDVAIVESMGSRPLDSSCLDSVKNSKTFGKVPDEIKGDVIVIRFVFMYYVR